MCAGRGVLLAVFFELASETGVFLVFKETTGPAIGRVGAEIGASLGGDSRRGCGCRRHRCVVRFGGCGGGRREYGGGSVGTLVPCAGSGGGAVSAILVSVAEDVVKE